MSGRAYEHAVHTWMFGGLPLPRIVSCLEQIGFSADLSLYEDGSLTPSLLERYQRGGALNGIHIPVTTAMFNSQALDLSSSDDAVRFHAVDFAKRCVAASARVGADRMLVSPSPVLTGARCCRSREADWDRAVRSLYELGRHAEAQNVRLMIEPINRYRVALIHTVAEALSLAAETGLDNVGVVADVFHMNMEEPEGVVRAIESAGRKLYCLHIGGSTRRVPGKDCFDWRGVLGALDRIGYDGVLSYEPAALYFDADRVADDPSCRERFLSELSAGKEYLDRLCL